MRFIIFIIVSSFILSCFPDYILVDSNVTKIVEIKSLDLSTFTLHYLILETSFRGEKIKFAKKIYLGDSNKYKIGDFYYFTNRQIIPKENIIR